jgi:hypothetical protein
MAAASVQWRTPTGHRFTSLSDSLSVDVEATTVAAEQGIAKVVFTITTTNVSFDRVVEVTEEGWRQPNFNTRPSPLTKSMTMARIPAFGITIDAGVYPPGDITITAKAVSGLGTETNLPRNIVIHNDSDGVDRRPCQKVIYLDADNGNNSFDGLTPETAKLTIQHGVESVANAGELGGGELVLLPATSPYIWANGRYGVPALTMSDSWPFVIRVKPGAKITRPGSVNPNSGGVIFTEPDDLVTLSGADVFVKLILEDPDNRQVEGGDLKVFMSNSGAFGLFQVEGGVSGSPYHTPTKRWSVKFVEDATNLWDPAPSGATNWELQYFCHERRGVREGFNQATLFMDCKVQDIVAIGFKVTGYSIPSPCNLELSGFRYDNDVRGLLDADCINAVTVTVPTASTMRIQQTYDIYAIQGGVVSSTVTVDLAEHAEELIGSPMWEVRFDSGWHVNNRGSFPVTAVGYDGVTGLPWFEVTNATATAETIKNSAKIYTHRPGNPEDYTAAIHPDLCQVSSDPVGAIFSGVRITDSSNTRGWSLQDSPPASITRLAMRNCDDGGFVNDFDTATFTDCVFEHCNMTGPWAWSHGSLSATNNTIRKCVINGHSNLPNTGSNVVDDCHFITGVPLNNGSRGSWFATVSTETPWDLTPQAKWHGIATSDPYVFYPYEVSFSNQPTPTRGVWQPIATGDWLLNTGVSPSVSASLDSTPPSASKYARKTVVLTDRDIGVMAFTDSVFLGDTDV